MEGGRVVGGVVVGMDGSGEGVESAGGDAEACEGENGAGLLAVVFGVAAAVPHVLKLLDLILELGSREVDGEAFFFFLVSFRLFGKHLGEPVGNAADDLSDASLGNLEFLGDPAGGKELD